MSGRPCRDCGYTLQRIDRGCPQCGLNLGAEKMIWGRLVPGVVVLVVLAAGLCSYLLL